MDFYHIFIYFFSLVKMTLVSLTLILKNITKGLLRKFFQHNLFTAEIIFVSNIIDKYEFWRIFLEEFLSRNFVNAEIMLAINIKRHRFVSLVKMIFVTNNNNKY